MLEIVCPNSPSTLRNTMFYLINVHSLHDPRRQKPVFGISDKVRLKPASSATETS